MSDNICELRFRCFRKVIRFQLDLRADPAAADIDLFLCLRTFINSGHILFFHTDGCAAAADVAVPKISFYACEPTVYFDVEDCDKVDAKMSAEDAETVKKMFEGKSAYFDSPSCGFDEKASIRIGCNTYMPACDGDEIVKHGFMYFSLSKSENNELRKIMKKYGADTRKAI